MGLIEGHGETHTLGFCTRIAMMNNNSILEMCGK